jgi:hypothetical protein
VRKVALLAVAVGAAIAVAGAGAAAETVTLSIRVTVNPNKTYAFVFSGQVSSGATGEDVAVLGRDCLKTGYRLIAGAQTEAGGYWQAEHPPPTSQYPPVASGVTWRSPMSLIFLLELRRGVLTVRVNPSPHGMNLAGKIVALQQFRGGRWAFYKRARLKLKPSSFYGAYNHEATFREPKRGLRLRAFLPAKSAAPCYLASASAPWRT